MKENLKEFLKPFIVNQDALELIVSKFQLKTVKRHEIILHAGNVCNEFYFIVQGGIRIFFLTQKGQEKTNHIALENTIISAMSSFISQEPSFEIIEALEDSDVLFISHHDFYSLVNSTREWELFYRTILERAYITKIKRVEARVTLSAKQRFELVMKENPNFIQRLPNRILASYIDITQETLSRLKSK